MAVSVVPMPACSAFECESSWIRAFADRASDASASSGWVASSRPGRNDSTAIREATSPACAPPMPSATTNSGERASNESSLARRWRPVSVTAYCSATRSMSVDLEGEFAVADADAVAGMQRPGGLEQLLVQVGAVRGAQILDHDYVSLLVDARVPRGGEGVLQPDLGAIAATQHDLAVEVVDHPAIVPGGTLDDQPRRPLGDVGAAERRRGVHPGRVGRQRSGSRSLATRRSAGAEVTPGAAGDPQQEQVQDGEEAELERHRYGLERRHPASKTTSVEPSSMRSPGCSAREPWISSPFTITPLVEPRSSIVHPPPRGRSWACCREMPTSSRTISQSRLRPTLPPPGGTSRRRPPTDSSARGAPRRACASSTGPPTRAEVL